MIELKNISKTYKTETAGVTAVKNVSLKIDTGEFVAIMGPSGSGKSTLMHLIGLLDRPDSGKYNLDNTDVSRLNDKESAVLRNRYLGFIFQQFHLLPRITAKENVFLPLIYAGKRHLKEIADTKIKEVGLEDRAKHMPNKLSGGEQQRIAIARALVNDPVLILADEPTGNLDTKSQNEIISILEELNKRGKTIILVTHEEEVADHAKRIIRMRDGEIVSDDVIKKAETKDIKSGAHIAPAENIISEDRLAVQEAEFMDHLRQAFSAIFAHKMRSVLSMLGILIGVSAVIAMLALGQGAKESIKQSLASLGSNLLTVRAGSHRLHGIAGEAGAVTRFTFQDVDAISKLPQVNKVSPQVSGRAQVVYANSNWNTQVQGVGVNYAKMRAAEPKIGRFFSEDEVRARKRVAVIGRTVAKELFGDNNPVDSVIKINRIYFHVIGVLPEKGANMWHDQDDIIVMPVTTAMYRLLGKEYIDSIDVEAVDPSVMDNLQDEIKELIIRKHRLTGDNQDSFEIRNMADVQETLASTARTMSWLLGSIAAISLLVGGIGIMNIMLVSVTERTREIGLRKAIGAGRKDIMTQFLVESVVMTISGGVMGILLGSGIAFLLATLAGWQVKVSLSSVLLAVIFSVVIGLIFGLWPAKKASGLDPIEALRYE